MPTTIEETVLCPLCDNLVPACTEEIEIGCDDCGSHPAYECPCCGETIDLVMDGSESLEA